ncbi:HIRAN domain-containing protein [Enterovirga aerilata]|uniref:HIRAN domain-containing protein n=1 Tax=Enterovirga aerilata TaxID=2730920 RepID=UPI001AEEA9AA
MKVGDRLTLVPEPDNEHDEDAVAYRHGGFHLGFVPSRHDWVARSLAEGDTIVAEVTNVEIERTGWLGLGREVRSIHVRLTITSDG